VFPQPEEGARKRLSPNWEQVEAFEPNLDVWAISSYPYFVFPSASDIPADYYTPLLGKTQKPVAIAEGGFSSRAVGFAKGSPEDQATYLRALDAQLGGERLAFWVNTLLTDLNMDALSAEMTKQGRNPKDAEALANFAFIGFLSSDRTPKPAMEAWDEMRKR